MENQRLTEVPDEYRPQTDDETVAAVRAVAEQRKQAEATALVNSLTDREKILIEYAWQAGADSARTNLGRRLIHPHASTLDAQSVKREVEQWQDTPEVFRPPYHWVQGYNPPHDPRIVNLVRSALRQLPTEVGEGPES